MEFLLGAGVLLAGVVIGASIVKASDTSSKKPTRATNEKS